jgi:hypothetical protein
MNTQRNSASQGSGVLARTLCFVFLGISIACAPQATPTFFAPPTAAAQLPTAAALAAPTSAIIVPTIAAPATAAMTATPCTNDLKFVQDLTIPDGTAVIPGEKIDKQWFVTNSGTCDWDRTYRFKLITGEALGAGTEQALYPARAGTQATLRIVFTAPPEAGTHQTAWQAIGPDGVPFGDTVYMQITVSP